MMAGVESTDISLFDLFYEPLQNQVQIKNPAGKMIAGLELYDLKGSIIFQKDILSEEKNIQIQLSALKPSVYLAKIISTDSYGTIKFVVNQ